MQQTLPQSLLVVFDCDSTLIQDEVIDLLADEAGTRTEVAEITERAMMGEMDFVESLRRRVAKLEGTPQEAFQRTVQRIRVTVGAPELISKTHELGGKVGVVSGGFHEVLDPLAAALGVDRWRANRLEVSDGKLTGKLVGPIIDAEAKAQALAEWAQEFSTPLTATVAIGDGANDLLMMEIAGLSVAFNAKPVVNAAADLQVTDDLSSVVPHLKTLVRA